MLMSWFYFSSCSDKQTEDGRAFLRYENLKSLFLTRLVEKLVSAVQSTCAHQRIGFLCVTDPIG
jgi:hypothetical protein